MEHRRQMTRNWGRLCHIGREICSHPAGRSPVGQRPFLLHGRLWLTHQPEPAHQPQQRTHQDQQGHGRDIAQQR